jgi:hypothetical protein
MESPYAALVWALPETDIASANLQLVGGYFILQSTLTLGAPNP